VVSYLWVVHPYLEGDSLYSLPSPSSVGQLSPQQRGNLQSVTKRKTELRIKFEFYCPKVYTCFSGPNYYLL
jgi:hypothetical protein